MERLRKQDVQAPAQLRVTQAKFTSGSCENTLSKEIDESPAMVAQRQRLDRLFDGVTQLYEEDLNGKGKGLESDKKEPNIANKSPNRSKAEMETDVSAAKAEVEMLVEKHDTTREVEVHFPSISRRYQLKHIGFNADGNIEIEINPKATINSSNKLISTGTQPPGDRTMNVTFESTSLGGSTVGTKMTANPIGPNHPQGGPPTGSALSAVMGKLVTNPSEKGHNKYIKGHLLNDNIGGPGTDKNLFPITGLANKKHHDDVEKTVKEWVNDDGYWVHYEVTVTNINSALSGDEEENYVDADFVCLAYPLTAGGEEAKERLSQTIHSEKGEKRESTGTGFEVDMEAGTPAAKDSKFNYQPELSTGRNTKINSVLDQDIAETLQVFENDNEAMKLIESELGEIKGIGGKSIGQIADFLQSGSKIATRVINVLNNNAPEVLGKLANVYFQLDENI